MMRSGYVAHMCLGFGVEGLGLRVLPIETFRSRTAGLESRRLLDYLTQGSSCVDFWITQLKACEPLRRLHGTGTSKVNILFFGLYRTWQDHIHPRISGNVGPV